jgi:hypothetical protein
VLLIGTTAGKKRRKQRKIASHPVIPGVCDSLRLIKGLGRFLELRVGNLSDENKSVYGSEGFSALAKSGRLCL